MLKINLFMNILHCKSFFDWLQAGFTFQKTKLIIVLKKINCISKPYISEIIKKELNFFVEV